ncbi:hypothetical protein P7K49_004255 [Saguinus oedipus]|uniref:Uncharacterized protein n=1 Tax=Saguinus oedipus TaxID=9490 RepID=A0ABQ9W8F2_SAGOE|nr:hypothetical protein P7K49_004255 [Saguinus oedipus]
MATMITRSFHILQHQAALLPLHLCVFLGPPVTQVEVWFPTASCASRAGLPWPGLNQESGSKSEPADESLRVQATLPLQRIPPNSFLVAPVQFQWASCVSDASCFSPPSFFAIAQGPPFYHSAVNRVQPGPLPMSADAMEYVRPALTPSMRELNSP